MYEVHYYTLAIDDHAALKLRFDADGDAEAMTVLEVFDRRPQQTTYQRAALYAVDGKATRRFLHSVNTREF
jgi:hypothetical protein